MIPITVNGKAHQVDVASDTPLLWVLRETLGLTGTKFGCGMAQCGACTVHLDGEADALLLTPVAAAGKKITTIEGLSADGSHPCSRPGSPRTCPSAATASRARSCPPRRCCAKPEPDDADIDAAMAGNSAAAGPISGFAARFTGPRGCWPREVRDEDDPRSQPAPLSQSRHRGWGIVTRVSCSGR